MATVSKFWVGKIANFRHKYMVKVLGSGLHTPPSFFLDLPQRVSFDVVDLRKAHLSRAIASLQHAYGFAF